MRLELLLWTFGLWGLMVVCAIFNAGLRQSVLIPSLGETLGRAVSTVTLSAAILVIAYVFLAWSDVERSGADLWLMGLMWLVLTVMFEFGFGHFVMGNSWDTLLHDYNILEGRIWVVVLAVTLTGPYLMGSLAERSWL